MDVVDIAVIGMGPGVRMHSPGWGDDGQGAPPATDARRSKDQEDT